MGTPETRYRAALVDGIRAASSRYEDGSLTLERLSWELKSRISALDGHGEAEWVDRLRHLRNSIEAINAVAIDSGRERELLSDREEVLNLLQELKVAL